MSSDNILFFYNEKCNVFIIYEVILIGVGFFLNRLALSSLFLFSFCLGNNLLTLIKELQTPNAQLYFRAQVIDNTDKTHKNCWLKS